jgi:sterol desaturase/sphingolipid hydroxylase (fatty acid hydroxylase superfamily)
MSTESGNGVINVIHFLLHGIHHKTPKDTTRLLAPVPMVLALAAPIYLATRLVLSFESTLALWSGILMGYVQYDYTHLYLHTPGKKPTWLRSLAKEHLAHHQNDHDKFYSISYLTYRWVKMFLPPNQ